MTSADFEDFFKDSGNTFEVEGEGAEKCFYFRDRGNTFCLLSNDANPQFLYVKIRFDLPPKLPHKARLQAIMHDLEEQYPVVKLRSSDQMKEAYFEVSAEQFEAGIEAVRAIFWQTIDLMRDVGQECYRRLRTQPETPNGAVDDHVAYVAGIEASLKRGCRENEDADAGTAVGKIRRSLALTISDDGSTASAFCVASTTESSTFLTNAHVVGEDATLRLYRQTPAYQQMLGTVVAKGDPAKLDLAIISVQIAAIPAVAISARSPRPDSPVALVGYARVQLWAAEALGELLPAAHLGTITAVNQDGSCILHDALSRPGNSGGPVFDPLTGDVFGVQRSGWESEEESIAIGQTAVISFLLEHDVKLNVGTTVLSANEGSKTASLG